MSDPAVLPMARSARRNGTPLISASEIDQKNDEKRGKKHHGIATTSIVNLRAAAMVWLAL
jgi:hypothetical protein